MTKTESLLTTLVMQQIHTNDLLTLQCRILLESVESDTERLKLSNDLVTLLRRHDVASQAWLTKLENLEI